LILRNQVLKISVNSVNTGFLISNTFTWPLS